MKKAQIITIGDEILIGQVVDSNSAWIGSKLNNTGIAIHEILSISDEEKHITDALSRASANAGLIIITGGLGPTKDDKTKSAICTYFKTELISHKPTFEHIQKFFKSRGMSVNELNKAQALIPAISTPLENPSGTAPGMWIEKNGCIYIFLPGVPYEMKSIMENQVMPRLKKYSDIILRHKTVLTQGIAESVLADKISHWESNLPSEVKLAYLPRPGIVRLRLSMSGKDENKIEQTLQEQIESLKQLIPKYIFGYDEEKLEEIIGKLLKKYGNTLATAESCTGGAIASLITTVPGSSNYFKGAIVAYENQVKTKQLMVAEPLIEQHGAVSKEVVEAMAEGCLNLLNTDFAISTSGVAGPTGGSPEKPVGTVWIAVASKEKTISEKYRFGENRERNITKSVMSALNMLRKTLLDQQ